MREFIKIIEDVYDDESDIPKFKEIILEAGTKLYHGTSANFNERNELLTSPAWFSDNPKTTEYFVDWNGHFERGRRRIIEYSLIKNVRLLHIENKSTLDDLEEYYYIDRSHPTEMASDICKLGYDGWIIPDNYTSGPDIMLCDASDVEYVKTRRAPPKSR